MTGRVDPDAFAADGRGVGIVEPWVNMTSNTLLRSISKVHEHYVHIPRVEVLARHISTALTGCKTVVDLGCGDTRLAWTLKKYLPEVRFEGFDLIARESATGIPIHAFDGKTLALPDSSVDAVMLIDVLHHADDPFALLEEATRVAARRIVIKDHLLGRWGAKPILKFMDWVSNRPYSVNLPYNYWSEAQWRNAWSRLELQVVDYRTQLGLYPVAVRLLFESGLHFIATLTKDVDA